MSEGSYEIVGWPACSRLSIGCQAKVANIAPSTLNLRDGPSLAGSLVTQLEEGASICVAGLVAPGDGYAWWNVSYVGGSG